MIHANYVNENRTVLVSFWENGQVSVARRPTADHTWGPPVPCFPERGYPTITGAIFGPAPDDVLHENPHGPTVEPAGVGSEGQPIVTPGQLQIDAENEEMGER